MNKLRRSELQTASEQINAAIAELDDDAGTEARALGLVQNAFDIVEGCHSEEEEGFYNLNEGLQATERGQMIEQAIEYLEEAKDGLEEILTGTVKIRDADLDQIDAFVMSAIDC